MLQGYANSPPHRHETSLESPASGTIGFVGAIGIDGSCCYFIHIPGWRPRALRTVISGERGFIIEHRCWLPLRAIGLGDTLNLGSISHFRSLPFDHEIEFVRGDRERTCRIMRKVFCFACARARVKVESTIHPERSNGPDVWSTI